MKKLLLTTIIASLLILPFGTVAMADMTEAPDTQAEQLDYAPGNVPAETGALDSMTPALHAAILAMVNLGQRELDLSDPVAAWETLYNMLSLYRQMDDRSEYLDEELVLPSETVMDYASALFTGTAPLSPIPEALSDRIRYDGKLDSYLLTCGDDSLAEIQLTSMDADGTRDGFDIDMLNAVAREVGVPVIASGGCGSLAHFAEVFEKTPASAALAASLFHFGELTVPQVKDYLRARNIPVR